jgi:uncharacterized membrane protein YdbT with pleckstrin-like domain
MAYKWLTEEKLPVRIKLSRKGFVFTYFCIFVLLALPVLTLWFQIPIPVFYFTIGLGLIWLIRTEIYRGAHYFEIDKNKVALGHGLLTKNVRAIYFDDVSGIKTTQTFWQRIFGYGTVYIVTQTSEEKIDMVPSPAEVRAFIERLEYEFALVRGTPPPTGRVKS